MNSIKTRLALLGTMSDLHTRPIRYDLANLQRIVADLSPDLLCAEITRQAWERGDIAQASVEVREALAPMIAATDIVLIPISPTLKQFADFMPGSGWRRPVIHVLDRFFNWGQMQANEAETVNGPWFGAFCHTICMVAEIFWTSKDRAAWEKQNSQLVENIVHAVQRDSGRRVLVAVQCQRLHRLVQLLRAHSDLLDIVGYQNL